MTYLPSVSRERRANLRRLRAEFEAAFDAMQDQRDRGSPAYREADTRYRDWIAALDSEALALLDDLDTLDGGAMQRHAEPVSRISSMTECVSDVRTLFAELNDLRSAAELIAATTSQPDTSRERGPRSRAMSIIGSDRAARLWHASLETSMHMVSSMGAQ